MRNPTSTASTSDLERERVLAELRVQESEARFRIMADAAPVMLWMSREDAMCTFFNQTWLDFTGRTQEEEWGVGWAESVHFEDLQGCLDSYVDAFNQRAVFEIEYRLRRADGEYRWILDRATPRYRPDGSFAGYIGSCIDITDRRRVELELRNALRSKQEFFATAAHELKTPMTALRLQLERFRRGTAESLTDRDREMLARMTASSDRVAELIDSILKFSRLQDGRMKAEIERFVPDTLVQRLVETSRPLAERKGLALHFLTAATGVSLRSDPAIVGSIVSRLLGNAIKFTDAGSIEVLVDSRATACTITIRDTGQGVSPADQARIFEPFQPLEPTRNKHTPGIGLGLPLAKLKAELIGGHISLDSQLGRGSLFTVNFPHQADEEPGDGA